jgi:hypothetical protein
VRVIVDPADRNRVLVRTGSNTRITSDGGAHWDYLTLPANGAYGFAFGASGTIWVATGSGLWYTTDSEVTWTLSPLTGDIREVGIDPRDPSLVYAQADGFVYRSSDGGAHFTRATGTGGVWSPHTTAF